MLTALARNMVSRYGMSDKMGPMAFTASARQTMFGDGIEEEASQEVAAQIDAAVTKAVAQVETRHAQERADMMAAYDLMDKRYMQLYVATSGLVRQ